LTGDGKGEIDLTSFSVAAPMARGLGLLEMKQHTTHKVLFECE